MSSSDDLTEHAARNRASWDAEAPQWVEPGRRNWAAQEPNWGIWQVPERELGVLPDVTGKDVVELGCGTAYWSAWLARRGARVVGLDNSANQLATARALQEEFGLEFPLIHASAEAVPLPDAAFDMALSEYGACLWCDPDLWISEAARLVRPGGWLVFLTNSPLIILCSPDRGPACDRLLRDQFGMRRFEWPDEDDAVEFHLPHGEMIRTLSRHGFEVLDLVELRAPEGGDPGRFEWLTLEWARRWPSEEIWVARRSPARTP
jgi:SAM-dependent methyltransferase